MKTLLANFLPRGGRSSSKQGHFAKNDSLLVGNIFPNPYECSARAAVVGTLLYSLQAMNTRINHTSERLSPEFPSGKIAKNRLYYYRCFRCDREVRKMLRVMLADLWMNVCNEQNVDCSFR